MSIQYWRTHSILLKHTAYIVRTDDTAVKYTPHALIVRIKRIESTQWEVHEEDIDQIKRRIGMKNEEMKYCIIGFIFFFKAWWYQKLFLLVVEFAIIEF
jgi:hypothetical protein